MLSRLIMNRKQSAGARYRARIEFAREYRIYRLLFAEFALAGENLLVHLAVACVCGAEGVSERVRLLVRLFRTKNERSLLFELTVLLSQSPRARICHPCISPRLLLVPAATRA